MTAFADQPERRGSSRSAGPIAVLNRDSFIDWSDLGPALAIGLGLLVIAVGVTPRN